MQNLCKYLVANGDEVRVLTYQPLVTKAKALPIERTKNFEIRRLQWPGFLLFIKLERSSFLELLYLTPALLMYSTCFMMAHAREVDVIHAHGLNAALITKFLGKIFKKRTVVSTHANYGLGRRRLMAVVVNWVMSSTNAILSLPDESKQDLLSSGIPEWKIRTYNHWVDQQSFHPRDRTLCRTQLGITAKFVVLFVGRFIERKGVRVLLDAANSVTSHDIIFVFVGDGPLEDELRRVASRRSSIVVLTNIPERKLVMCYNAADVFIIPSLYDEPYGRVVLESLSCGTPVIASRKGNLPQIVPDSVGFLVEPEAKTIADRIIELSRNPQKLPLRETCRRFAEDRFGLKNAQALVDTYDEVFLR